MVLSSTIFGYDYLVYTSPDCSTASLNAATSQYSVPVLPMGGCMSVSEKDGNVVHGQKIVAFSATLPRFRFPGLRLDNYQSAADCASRDPKKLSWSTNFVSNACGINYANNRLVFDKYPNCVMGVSGPVYSYSRYGDSKCTTLLAGDAGTRLSVVPNCIDQRETVDDARRAFLNLGCESAGKPTRRPTPSPTTPTSVPTLPVPATIPTTVPAQPVDYTQPYLITLSYMSNTDCVNINKAASPSFTADLLEACLPTRGTYGGVSATKTTLSGSAYTKTFYSDLACTTPAPSTTTVTFTANTQVGSTTVTLTSQTANIYPGAPISGPGIPASTTVSSWQQGNTFTISDAATATGTGVTLSSTVTVNGNVCNGVGCPTTIGVCTATNGQTTRSFVSSSVPNLSDYFSFYYASYMYMSSQECNTVSAKIAYVNVDATNQCSYRGSYNALFSCPSGGAIGGAVVTAKATTDSTCTGASTYVYGTTSSYTETPCYQMYSMNSQGQNVASPLYVLTQLSTCGSYGRPTPLPSASPTTS